MHGGAYGSHQITVIVGACIALRNSDSMNGTRRSHGHPIGNGAELDVLMAELSGNASGVCQDRGGSMHLADGGVGIISDSSFVSGGIPLASAGVDLGAGAGSWSSSGTAPQDKSLDLGSAVHASCGARVA